MSTLAQDAQTTYTLRMKSSQKKLISEYAKMHGTSMADFMLGSALDRIEGEMDMRDWIEAKAAYEANPVTYSMDEVMREFGLR